MMISPPRSPGAGSQTSSVVCRGQKFGPISSIKPSRALYCGAQPGSQECTVSQRSSPHQTCQDTSGASRTSQMMSDEPFIFFFHLISLFLLILFSPYQWNELRCLRAAWSNPLTCFGFLELFRVSCAKENHQHTNFVLTHLPQQSN